MLAPKVFGKHPPFFGEVNLPERLAPVAEIGEATQG